MFRLALVSYLTASMLAGPAVCCCTTADLFGGTKQSSHKDHASPSTAHCHGHRAGHSCHGHRSHSRHRHTDASQHEIAKHGEVPDAPVHPCSCRETRFDALTTKVNNSEVDSLLRLQFAFLDAPTFFGVSPLVLANLIRAAVPDPGTTTFPHMSAPEILRALQTFRC